MSGGVDSSAAALLLKKQGYQITGVFMRFWHERGVNENRCCSREARQDAMRVCAKLKIPFLTWDFQKEFKKKVVNDFIRGYKKGLTPNPCAVCNKEIKFGFFLKKALKTGADYVATGHYIKNKKSKIKNQNDNSKFKIIYKLFQAKDKNKDQSYFLWTLTQNQLSRCLFPVGNYLKSEVRQIMKKTSLFTGPKKESQEICFIKNAKLNEFLKSKIRGKTGDIIELKTNKKIGEHPGVQFYTIGQRAPVGGTGPYFVFAKNFIKNRLLVVEKNDKDFFRKEINLNNVNWIAGEPPITRGIRVRLRYRQPPVKCQASNIKYRARITKVIFSQPQKFVAFGQSAVFYNQQGELLGGGIIV